mmetsp:Transcript_5914/g.9072  ORF Transcript_5914/g.9072 Transcript_5914/m.9072 type:complete len:94 (-) Transcript_5914:1228-1509(-)
MLADCIWDMGYRPSKADPDVWLKPAIMPDGSRYYSMLLCYLDDVISINMKPRVAIDGIEAVFKLRNDTAEVPEMYLGGGLSYVENASGTKCCI